jgi:hypothetical protein
MSSRAFGSAASRLRSHSLRLRADEHPYYLHTPRGRTEPAPGWYWRPRGAQHPVYLAHNSHEAEYQLRLKLDAMRAGIAEAGAKVEPELREPAAA